MCIVKDYFSLQKKIFLIWIFPIKSHNFHDSTFKFTFKIVYIDHEKNRLKNLLDDVMFLRNKKPQIKTNNLHNFLLKQQNKISIL